MEKFRFRVVPKIREVAMEKFRFRVELRIPVFKQTFLFIDAEDALNATRLALKTFEESEIDLTSQTEPRKEDVFAWEATPYYTNGGK